MLYVIITCMVTFVIFSSVTATRPKHLTMFINPIGGHGKAEKEYTDVMKPLFDLANISCEVIGKFNTFIFKRMRTIAQENQPFCAIVKYYILS